MTDTTFEEGEKQMDIMFPEFDPDIREYAMAEYNGLRGPGNRYSHKVAYNTAHARAGRLQWIRSQGYWVSASKSGYGTDYPG